MSARRSQAIANATLETDISPDDVVNGGFVKNRSTTIVNPNAVADPTNIQSVVFMDVLTVAADCK
jgi:hypothetical protein